MVQPPPQSSLPALLGAAVAAIGASVCCVVPLVLVLLGISGAWIAYLTALDAWRPWFSAATLVCLRRPPAFSSGTIWSPGLL